MKTSFVSNLSMQNTMTQAIAKAQQELVRLNEELVTERHADVGTVLGAKTARTLNLHRDLQRLESLSSTNALTTQRLAASQEALGLMSEAANSAMETIIALSGTDSQDQLDLAKDSFADAISLFTASANTSFSGEYLFAGINSDIVPINDYMATGSTAKDAFDAAFLATFGFAQDDAQTADITEADMTAFIADLETSFLGADWNTNWSNASDENMTSRISNTEVIQSSTNSNVEGMRKFALGAVIGYELLNLDLSDETRTVVSDSALDYIGQSVSGIDSERSTLGISEARVTEANVSLDAQITILTTSINNLEAVDTSETAVRITTLESQLSLAYTLTSRIQNMSLINYL
ncbi:flagellar hook-associated family protein [Rhizobium sp. TRM95111]|uniref:flagellar hook-associated family protein n=1 Tax=Rhizobium alarense TaxID=2846851 RepID=UPI001F249E6D|nr:flagellar hook-associated family protein [Rhizobium alarense]MCF3639557.1 flagellar hook-associated family protein [Rhizobium alarense]